MAEKNFDLCYKSSLKRYRSSTDFSGLGLDQSAKIFKDLKKSLTYTRLLIFTIYMSWIMKL